LKFTGDGNVSLNAGDEILSNASLHTGGNLEIRGNSIVLGGPVEAGGNLTIIGRDSHALIVLTGRDAWSRAVSFDENDELSEGNQGTSINIEDIDITALTSIESGSSNTGTLYLVTDSGLGVQNLNLGGSKGLSGKGGDDDEAIIFNFNTDDILPESLLIALNDYKPTKAKPVINLSLSTGDDFIFTTDHQNWDDAITYVGSSGAIIDLGVLLGPLDNAFVDSLSVMETADHLYVGDIEYSKGPEWNSTQSVWSDVWAKSTLEAGGDIEISATGDWRSNYYPGTITLEGDVTAAGNIKLYNDTYTTNLTGNGVKLQAGQDIFLVNDNLGDTKIENCTFLQGQDKLAIIAGTGNGVTNGQIHGDLTEISVTGSSLILEQDLDLDTADFLLGNQNNTHLTLISNEGSVTSTTGANAANKWKSIGAHADKNITLAKDGDPITIKLGQSGTPGRSLWAENGYIDIDGFNVSNSPINPTGSVEAGTTLDIDVIHGIDLGGDVISGGNMRLHADTDTNWGHDVVVGGNINAAGTLDIEGSNVDIQNAYSGGDMSLYAHGLYDAISPPEPLVGSGDVYVRGTLNSDGKIELRATEYGTGGSTTGPGFEGGTIPYSADGTIYLYDVVTADEDILIYNNTWAEDDVTLYAGANARVLNGSSLTGAGDLTVEAIDEIELTGAVQAVDNLTLDAGCHSQKYAHNDQWQYRDFFIGYNDIPV